MLASCAADNTPRIGHSRSLAWWPHAPHRRHLTFRIILPSGLNRSTASLETFLFAVGAPLRNSKRSWSWPNVAPPRRATAALFRTPASRSKASLWSSLFEVREVLFPVLSWLSPTDSSMSLSQSKTPCAASKLDLSIPRPKNFSAASSVAMLIPGIATNSLLMCFRFALFSPGGSLYRKSTRRR